MRRLGRAAGLRRRRLLAAVGAKRGLRPVTDLDVGARLAPAGRPDQLLGRERQPARLTCPTAGAARHQHDVAERQPRVLRARQVEGGAGLRHVRRALAGLVAAPELL